MADADPRVSQVLIVTPDKDLGQCVRGTRVVQYDRRKDEIVDEAGVTAKFGVRPASIADYLALVGDSADGYPGLPGWGAKSASTVLAKFGTHRGHPGVVGRLGPARPARRGEAGPHAAATRWPTRCCSEVIATIALDVPVGTVDDWRVAWADRRRSPRWPRGWAPRIWPSAPSGCGSECMPELSGASTR